MKILLLFLLVFGCSSKKKMNDSDLKNAQNERNRKIMLQYGHLIMPPSFDKVPLEVDSNYIPPKKENKKKWYEII